MVKGLKRSYHSFESAYSSFNQAEIKYIYCRKILLNVFWKYKEMYAEVEDLFFLNFNDPMAPHSSTLAWKIQWTEEPGRLQSMGSLSQTRLSDFTFTFHFHALEKEMATHSSVLAWRIPGMGEPGGLPSMGSHRIGHEWSDLAAVAVAVTSVGGYMGTFFFPTKDFVKDPK